MSSLAAAGARRADAASLAALRQGSDRPHPDRPMYRIGLRYAGVDLRHSLQEAVLDAAEIDAIAAQPARPRLAIWASTQATVLVIDKLPANRPRKRTGRDAVYQVLRPIVDDRRIKPVESDEPFGTAPDGVPPVSETIDVHG